MFRQILVSKARQVNGSRGVRRAAGTLRPVPQLDPAGQYPTRRRRSVYACAALLLRGMIAVACALAACNPNAGRPHTPTAEEADMIVIAHRGASGYAPEHTFAAYDLALELGADYLEQDLQMTRDGVLVVLHDDTLDRTTNGVCRGRVIDHTLHQLRECEVGSWFNAAHPERARPEYVGEPIPTLDEVFARYAGRTSFYVETKNPVDAPGMEEALLALLDRHGLREAAASEWRVLIQSFSTPSLRKIHALDPSLPLIQLIRARWATARSIQARLPEMAHYAVGIGPSWRDVDAPLVAAAREQCLEVHPYTVNEPAHMQELTDAGVTGMFTDVPDVLLAQRPADERRGREALRAAAQRLRECRQAASR
jgi:glycerophosphoryl diester phosphodiesterase